MIGQARADRIEQGLEHPAHREHRRARIHRRAGDRDLADLAAGLCRTLEHTHLDALGRQFQRSDEPADAGADHDHACARHCGALATVSC